MVTRGFGHLSYVHSAAETIEAAEASERELLGGLPAVLRTAG
jgi:hypothetical protein